MTDSGFNKKKSMSKVNLRSLRLSLKYRPELLKLILKMRQCIRKRNGLLKSLKHRLKLLESKENEVTTTGPAENLCEKDKTENVSAVSESISGINIKEYKDSSTQTFNDVNDQEDQTRSKDTPKLDVEKEDAGWNINGHGENPKSIAEQVKEAAQSALQDSGMVYVESAGMYYDYKTGYYYNSELGLYYHNDTGCYYHYSDDKKFVFHSYPDMSKVNASLIAHQNKKARKLKRERKPEDDIDNLTKHLSQDKEEDASNPKKARKAKKLKKEKDRKIKDKMTKNKKRKEVEQEGSIDKTMDGIKDIQTEENEATKVISAKDETSKIEVTNSPSESQKQGDSMQSADVEIPLDIFETINDSEETTTKADHDDSNTKVDDLVDSKIEIDKSQSEEEGEIDEDQSEKQVKTETKAETKNEDLDEEVKEEENEELEDGECSDTESEESGSESDASTSTVSDEDCIAMHHPPCMRVIVRETKLPKLKVGSLFLITKDGGTIGREGDNHAILLKDHNVSRNHLDIKYDVVKKIYIAIDLGSKNGTILNGVRMSESQDVSAALDVLHGSTIQLGETKLLCHIHPGHTTCGQCEPGLLMQVEEEKKTAYTRTVSVKKQYELELARLKNTYAPQRLAIEEKPYNDRAQARRDTVGSTNHAEKTQASDLDTSIPSENKGFKLLEKMGWSKGEGLGKDRQGDTEPVPLISNDGKAGLGNTGAVASPSNTPKPRVIKNNIASATMRLAARTKMLQPPAKAFQNEEEDDLE